MVKKIEAPRKKGRPVGLETGFQASEDPLGYFIAEAARQGLFSIPDDIMVPRKRNKRLPRGGAATAAYRIIPQVGIPAIMKL